MSEDHCGIRITPHMLRHTFATRMMATASASTVQLLLGHKRLSSTQIYLHPTLKHCIDAVSSQKCL
jgi:integrase/recombinase XerD